MAKEKLAEYRAKRDFATTNEPAGRGATAGEPAAAGRFVVQEHHATRLHWDLRLEHDGALASWAVPNGIPDDPKRNHLSVRTEDHPLEYLEFHGEIPKGQYGAGSMTIWDQGTYEAEKWRDGGAIRRRAGGAVGTVAGGGWPGPSAVTRRGGRGGRENWLTHRMAPPADPDAERVP